jgi:hypothetical protein
VLSLLSLLLLLKALESLDARLLIWRSVLSPLLPLLLSLLPSLLLKAPYSLAARLPVWPSKPFPLLPIGLLLLSLLLPPLKALYSLAAWPNMPLPLLSLLSVVLSTASLEWLLSLLTAPYSLAARLPACASFSMLLPLLSRKLSLLSSLLSESLLRLLSLHSFESAEKACAPLLIACAIPLCLPGIGAVGPSCSKPTG